MPNCIPPGWGNSGWGWDPWGGGGPLKQNLPVHPPFDVYCVGPCDEIANISQFFLVDLSAGALHDPLTGNLMLDSGGQGVNPPEEWLEITKGVPSVWTLEFTCKFHHLPPQLTSIQMAMGRVFVGCWSEQGGSAGLFFSAESIGYAAHPDDPIIPIPDSKGIINELDYWTVRLVANNTTGALFVYITKSLDLNSGSGHALRFVLPLPAQTGSHYDRTYVSVLGTQQIHNELELQGVCLAQGPVIPNMPPVADAGNEQEVKLCTIGQLDGSASFDPEGSPITYHWRLTDAPVTSAYVYEGYDAWTDPDPSGFTNELHTRNSLDPLAGGWNVQPGDVVVVGGVAYAIQLVDTTNPLDQVIQIDGYNLPAGEQFPHYFKIVRQFPLRNHETVNPTFYPDAAGFWKFDLVVSDGHLYSEPAVVVVSVRESPVPRGCTPDVGFIWDYLSDFWQLVDGKEMITTVWGAVAQIVASQLMTLWQIDYNKSLRDIQRTMVRKWLYYDLLVQEPFFDLTRCPCLDVPDGFLSGDAGQVMPAQPPAPWPSMPPPLQLNPYGYRTNVRLDDKGIKRGDLLVLYGKAYRIDKLTPPQSDEPGSGGQYRGELVLIDPIYDVPPAGPLPNLPDWSIVRPVTSSQIDFWGGLVCGAEGLDSPGDDAIVEVLDKQTGSYQFFKCQVLGVCEQLPHAVAVDPTEWAQYAQDTTKRYELYFVAVFRRHYVPINDRIRDVPYLQVKIKDPPEDEVLHRNVDFFLEQFRGRACIRFENVWVHQELDQNNTLVWATDPTPPARLWAEFTHIENLSVVESNFGILAGLTVQELEEVDATMPGDIDYLSAVQGLWYVYLSTPSPWNMRIGAQILLGLPFAEEDGEITQIIPNLNVSATRLLVTDNNENGIVRAYDYPDGLELETNPETGEQYQEGDQLKQFQPISTGVQVLDWIKDPNWISPYIDQGTLYEIHKYFYFPVVIENEAFTLAGALLVRKLMLNVRPSYTYPIVVVRFDPDRVDIDVEESLSMLVTLTIHEGPCTHFAQQHPKMWNAGDTGPATFFPHPEEDDTTTTVLHRHENYTGWFSSWKSQYGQKDYPDVGYADFYEEGVSGIAFPYQLQTMPDPLGGVAMFVQAQPYGFTPKALHIEVTPNTAEPAPVYTIELLYDGVSFMPPVKADFTVTLAPGETTFQTTVQFPAAVPVSGDKPLTAVLTVGPGGSGTPDWASCRFTWYVTYWYVAPSMWGYWQGSNQQHPWPAPPPAPPYQGADMLCPEASLEVTTYMAWPAQQVVQYNTIFIHGEPVYPAYIDTSGPDPTFVVDWNSPSHSVAPGSGDPGWSFGQLLDPPPAPYTGYVSKKFV